MRNDKLIMKKAIWVGMGYRADTRGEAGALEVFAHA